MTCGDAAVLMLVAADAARAGGATRTARPARAWAEQAMVAAGGAPDGVRPDSVDDALRCALEIVTSASGGSWRPAVAIHAGCGDLRPRAASVLSAVHVGQIVLTADAADLAFNALPPEVSLQSLGPHRLADLSPPQELFQLCHDRLLAHLPPLRSLDRLPHNLPVQPTSYFGHPESIERVAAMVRGRPLVTLTGPGGVGKTRTALQAAAAVAHDYPDGVWLVELAHVDDGASVGDRVIETVCAGGDAGRAPEDALGDQQALVVLDNCEHLLAACADTVARIIRTCPGVRVIATSREPLRLAAEAVVGVRPLETGPRSEAVQMFTDRARMAGADVPPDPSLIAEICRRLDGIPLAIELAAARSRHLGVREIADGLDDRFALLASGPQDLPTRQRTLRSLVDWSYALLSGAEQALFGRLAVFRGGFDLDAVRAVCCGSDVRPEDARELLSRLVNCSLVTTDGAGRFGMLETLREYAQAALGDDPGLHARHVAWMVDFVERGNAQLFGPEQQTSLGRFEAERDNLHAALRTALNAGDLQAASALAGGSMYFWEIRGHHNEARAWIDEITARVGDAPPFDYVEVLSGAASLAFARGELERSKELHARTLELERARGARPANIAVTLQNLAIVSRRLNRPAEARRLFEESAQVAREAGLPEYVIFALGGLARMALDEGDLDRARTLHEDWLELAREVGNAHNEAIAVMGLGLVADASGDAQATALLDQAVAALRDLGARPQLAQALIYRAKRDIASGDLDGARAKRDEARAIGEELGLALVLQQCQEFDDGAPSNEPAPSAMETAGRRFYRDGSTWVVLDGEIRAALDDSRGLQHLAVLLARPGTEVHCLELVGVVRTEDARAEHAELTDELQRAESDGDTARVALVRRRMDVLATGVASGTREMAVGAERARQSATKAIKAAIERISAHAPALGHHLGANIRTGVYCCYLPGPGDDAPWDVDTTGLRAAAAGPVDGWLFAREGERWILSAGGPVVRLRDLKGMRYVAHLLRTPSREIHVLDLVAAVDRLRAETRPPRASDDVGPVLDDVAVVSYRRRLAELRAELDAADAIGDAAHGSLQEEYDAVASALRAGTGLGGRRRRTTSDAERARVMVGKAIRTAIAEISRQAPDMGQHLRAAVRTGAYCIYDPGPGTTVHWKLRNR